MWQGYSQNFFTSETYNVEGKILGKKVIHMLFVHSAYKYWQNDEFLDDEESSVDKLMILIRAKAMKLSQNDDLYKIIINKIAAKANYEKLRESIRDDMAPFYRKSNFYGQVSKEGRVEHQGLLYPQISQEKVSRPMQISEGRKATSWHNLEKWFLIEKKWLASLYSAFSEASRWDDLENGVKELHPLFCNIYPFEIGTYFYDETAKEFKWKSKREQEEIEVDPDTGKPLDDEALRDLEETEYNQMKAEGKLVKDTWYLEGTHRFLLRLKQEVKKLAAGSKQKQEQRIEAAEKLIKIYEKTYENPDLKFFTDTLNEVEGFEEFKNIVGNYFTNLLYPTTTKFRPKSIILVGYPGTGKSRIASQLALASKRAFFRLPLGGVDEPTYLKGREIAYAGADQGSVLKLTLTKSSCQSIFLCDEFEKAGAKAITDIIGAMTDPDQNAFSFEDDWLKWKIDLSKHVFILTANYVEKIEPFLLSRSQVVKVGMMTYKQRVNLVKKNLGKILGENSETARYVEQLTNDFCKYIITEDWGVRQTLANLDNVFLALRAFVLSEQKGGTDKAIADINNIKEVIKTPTEYKLIYQEGQKIILVRSLSKEKGLDGIEHTVFTDVPDWPGATPHDHQEERQKITFLDLNSQDLYNFDFSRYPDLEILDIGNNKLTQIDLTNNKKLKYLDISHNINLNDISWNNNIEELHVSNIGLSEIDLKKFTKLKKLSYDFVSDLIHLPNSLKNKVKLLWAKWEDLYEEEKILYKVKHQNASYEETMKNIIVWSS
ncbi:MAG: ATP-dependent protease La [Mycoplasmataceae bacterium RV_VA103A]|nr:MAG: ATP-dependent protease La [Mycoplasmataceae bacterium RV_VA103A]